MSIIAERCNCACHSGGHCMIACCENAKQPHSNPDPAHRGRVSLGPADPVSTEGPLDIESRWRRLGISHPSWYSFTRGAAMRVTHTDLERRAVVISSHAGDRPAAQVLVNLNKQDALLPWRVEWRLLHSNGEASGHVFCTTQTLKRAFGLDDSIGDMHNNWPNRFNATTAVGRVFVRKGLYLCIPGPGTADDGHPVVSIELNDKMVYDLFQITRDM